MNYQFDFDLLEKTIQRYNAYIASLEARIAYLESLVRDASQPVSASELWDDMSTREQE